MQEIITEGSTLVEAVDKACKELGVSRDDVTYEVLVQPVKKLFKRIPARVKVTVRGEDISVQDLLRQEEKKHQQPVVETVVEPEKTDVPVKEEKEQEKPHKDNHKKHHKKKHKDNKPQVSDAAETETAEIAAEKEEAPIEKEEAPVEEVSVDDLPIGAKAAFEYLKTIAAGLGATNLEYKAVKIKDGVKFIIDGEDAAALIGRRGETMDSLQYLCLLVSNRASDDYCKIAIDVAEYRSKREKTLEALAKKVASKVLKTHYSQTLEPMNPYERRIVHATIQAIEGVKSESIGQEPNRRVVVSLIGGKEGGHDRRRSSRDNKRSRGPRDRRERKAVRDTVVEETAVMNEERQLDLQVEPKEYQRIDMKSTVTTVKEETIPEKKVEEKKNFNLYSKIEL